MSLRVLSCDPGLRNTAFCYFKLKNGVIKVRKILYFDFYPEGDEIKKIKDHTLVSNINKILKSYFPKPKKYDRVFIECLKGLRNAYFDKQGKFHRPLVRKNQFQQNVVIILIFNYFYINHVNVSYVSPVSKYKNLEKNTSYSAKKQITINKMKEVLEKHDKKNIKKFEGSYVKTDDLYDSFCIGYMSIVNTNIWKEYGGKKE